MARRIRQTAVFVSALMMFTLAVTSVLGCTTDNYPQATITNITPSTSCGGHTCVRDTVTVTVNAQDDICLSEVGLEYKPVGGSFSNAASPQHPGVKGPINVNFSWNTTQLQLADGDYVLRGYAIDNHSPPQRTNSAEVSVRVDNHDPTVSITEPSSNALFVVGDQVEIKASASDTMGINRVEFSYSGPDSGSLETDESPPDCNPYYCTTWDTSGRTAGVYTLTATAYDGSCRSKTASVQVTVNDPCAGTSVSISQPASPNTKFTFDDASPGVCTIAAQASAQPPACSSTILWDITPIAGSADNADTLSGPSVTIKYTGLPTNNTFGSKNITARVRSGVSDTQEVLVFFLKTATNHPGGTTPNWYYYWSNTSASSGTHHYLNVAKYGEYNEGEDHFNICALACTLNDNTGHTGIDAFAETCIHENLHKTHWEDWHALPDADGDWLPDSMEDANGNGVYDPPTDPSDWQNDDTNGNRIDDEDELCYAAERNWGAGSANEEDWANPGKQSN